MATSFALGLVPFIIGFLAWYVIATLNIPGLEYVVPHPTRVAIALAVDLSSPEFLRHFNTTMLEVFWGLLIAIVLAVMLGTAIGLSQFLERMLYPAIVFFQAVPKVALAPLWVVVFGFGIGSKIALAAMVAFFPLLVGVIVGMSATRREEFELMSSLRATTWQTFWKVRVPRALPSFFGGLEVGVIFALIGAVVGEFVGAQAGLGYLIQFRSARLDLPGVFSPLIVLSVIGLVLDLGTKAIGRRLMKWEHG